MNKLKCLFLGHTYKYISIEHYYDNSFTKNGTKSTCAVRKCSTCNKLNRQVLYGMGFLSIEDLNET